MRVLLVDDSASMREVLAQRLVVCGHVVTQASDPLSAAELALAQPPDIVVTDLWMPGVSGVQLCRLLKSEPRTSHVPVILVTSESQRRSRFWARTAGAAAYVPKSDPTALEETIARVALEFPPQPPDSIRSGSRIPMQHRLFQQLDVALFESVIAGEVRALANVEAEPGGVFRGLANLISEVTAYRWLAVRVQTPSVLLVHCHPEAGPAAETEARAALEVPPGVPVELVSDDRAVLGQPSPAVTGHVRVGGGQMGAVALGPGPRGASRDDRQLVALVATELAGPLRVVALLEESRQLATSDPLTGLLNRRAFTQLLGRSLAMLERYGHDLSLLLLDVDHFKKVNDTHGHDGGDAVLGAISRVLKSIARKTDFVGRWGGEEFVVGLTHTGLATARIPAERARRAIMANVVHLPAGTELQVTASIGVATAIRGETLETLVSRADHAMYRAKAAGRNRYEVAEDGRAATAQLGLVAPTDVAFHISPARRD